ncbi:MAG TPA: ribonuclease R [Burkholderiales bacterium]|nr:ribonuclease R [Burkholderiales bacterium]
MTRRAAAVPDRPKLRKRGGLRASDPFLAREQQRYDYPLPSREWILSVLKDEGVPVEPRRLRELLEIRAEEVEAFDRRLSAMERDGQIMQNRAGALCMVDKLGLIRGRVAGHPDGFGFLVPEDGGGDLFLSPWEMTRVFHGDRVMARVMGTDRRGRREGAIVEVLERAHARVVGRLHEEHGVCYLVPEDRRLSHDILVPREACNGARSGQVVVAEIIEQPDRHVKPIGRIVEVLGNYADPGMEVEIALRKHDLPHVFPPAAEALAAALPTAVRKRDWKGRGDLTRLPLVTIDSETAKDFDDAVYCEREGKGFRLWVGIADVSHYVMHGDALDHEARARGNSVYFPRRVIPMLPETLSNGLCSLNPEVERLCLACEMVIGARGDIKDYRFYPAVMRSRARLTYTTVAEILAGPDSEQARRQSELAPHLHDLYALFQVLVKARERRGAIDFESLETRMEFDDQGKITAIYPVQRNDAHRLIEECMLAANVSASDFLQRHGHRALYRIHEGPTPEKLKALREFLREFGLHLGGGDDPRAKDYAELLIEIRGRPDYQLLQTVLLRSLRQAVYSPENVGHFGLAYEAYTHFTSPIRRYPDLLVHRGIKAALAGEIYAPGDWVTLGQHCSETERRADEATRDVEAWLKAYYMRDRVGERFAGTISGVAAFGVFVALDEVYVEGMVHVSELGNDYFNYDAARHQLMGERTRKRFRLGDRIQVKLVRSDLETTRLDFVLADKPH